MKTKFLLTMLALWGAFLGAGCRSIDHHEYPQMPSRKNREAFAEAQTRMDGKKHGIWVAANTNVVIESWRKFDPLREISRKCRQPKRRME